MTETVMRQTNCDQTVGKTWLCRHHQTPFGAGESFADPTHYKGTVSSVLMIA